MADLSTTFAGLKLECPIVVSSAGVTESVEKMRKCQQYGAGAVVMKSYFEEEICRKDPSPRYRIIKDDGRGGGSLTFVSYEQASDWDIDRYAEEVRRATSELDIKVFASINCITQEGWVEAARKVAEAGAQAIELNTSCPHGSITFRGGPVERVIFDTVRAVREAVDIPLVAKISPMLTSPIGVTKELEAIGVEGVTIFNRMTGLEIDVDEERPIMHGGYAGHGGPWAIRYPLRWISQIYPQVGIDIAGSGGVTRSEDVVKYLLAGATVVQVCTLVVLNGYQVIRELRDGLERWMDAKGYGDLGSFRGRAARRVLGTEQIDRTQKFVAFIRPEPVAPCEAACPARVPAQAYVHRIATGDFAGALEVIRAATPFQSVCGWVCYAPCEAECTRGQMDEPLAIRALKRFAIEWGRRNASLSQAPVHKGEPTGKKVAIVGSGPAGLTAAYDLARLGHQVTVLEAHDAPGGMLRTAIPSHRLPDGIVDDEIAYIERHGVEIRCNQALGSDFTLDELRGGEYDAVLLAFGAHRSARLEIPGEDADGVVGALDFLREVNRNGSAHAGRRVAVVGGGNTALDAARCALRCGSQEVYLVYRRSRTEMPATDDEIEEAEREGVRILYLAMPVGVESCGGQVAGLRIRGGHLSRPGGGGRRAPVPVEDIEYVLKVNQVIVAVSQIPGSDALQGASAIQTERDGAVRVLDEFGSTGREGVFAAGDVTGRTGSVIEAIAAGRRAALAVDCYLNGDGVEKARERWGEAVPVDKHKVLTRSMEREPASRVEIPMREPEARAKDFEPVELPLTEEQAVREAERCLRCGCGIGCELCYKICPYEAILPEGVRFVVDREKCTGCGLCIERCPNDKIDAVPLEQDKR